MGGDHHRFGDILYVRQRPHDLLAGGDIQIGGRLVQQQNAGVQGNADGETCPSHLAAGEKPAVLVLQFRQPEAGQQFVGARLPVFNIPYLHGIGDIGTDGILDKHLLRILINKGNASRQLFRLFLPGAFAVQEDIARPRLEKAHHQFH